MTETEALASARSEPDPVKRRECESCGRLMPMVTIGWRRVRCAVCGLLVCWRCDSGARTVREKRRQVVCVGCEAGQ